MLTDFVKYYLKLIQLDPQLVILFGKIRKFVDFFLEAVEQSLVGGNFLLDFRYIGLTVNYDRLQFMLKLSYYFVNVICSCIKIINSHALFIVFFKAENLLRRYSLLCNRPFLYYARYLPVRRRSPIHLTGFRRFYRFFEKFQKVGVHFPLCNLRFC